MICEEDVLVQKGPRESKYEAVNATSAYNPQEARGNNQPTTVVFGAVTSPLTFAPFCESLFAVSFLISSLIFGAEEYEFDEVVALPLKLSALFTFCRLDLRGSI